MWVITVTRSGNTLTAQVKNSGGTDIEYVTRNARLADRMTHLPEQNGMANKIGK